jgi:hypothetical protein
LQPLSILFGAGFTVAVGYGLGALLLKRFTADAAIRFVAGSALLSALVFTACALGLVYPPVFLLAGVVAIAAARSEFHLPHFSNVSRVWLIFVPFFVLYLSNAMAPEISFDGSRYHLGLVARILREHGFHPIHDNFYAAFPQGIEMLYLFAFAFGRHSAAAVTHLAFLVALSWQVFTWVRREGGEVAGLAAAFLVFASPLMGVDGTSALIDVAVAAVVFTLFRVLLLWDEKRSAVLLGAAGLLAGFGVAGKYTAFLVVPCAVAFVWWRSRSLRAGLVVATVAALAVAPWLVKNYLWFGNPFAPFFNRYFPNQYLTTSFETEYRRAQILPIAPWQLAVAFGPVFLLAPLGRKRWLWLSALAAGAGFVWNTGDRFLIPALPFVAASICLAFARQPRILFVLMGLHAILSWPTVLRRYCRPDTWRLDKVTYREALRIKPENGYLESNLVYYGAACLLDRATPPSASIFMEVPIPEAYTERHVLVGYQSAANVVSRRVWFTGFVPEHAPVWRASFRFQPRSATAIRVGSTRPSWTLHELRIYLAYRELPRDSWRTSAPEVLDGRQVSFWMANDLTQSVEVVFPSTLAFDRVVLETAMDQPDARYTLEARDTAGRWEPLGAPTEFDQIAPPDNLRLQAAQELHRRGIDYLLLFDGEFGADDVRTRTAQWGVTQVTEYKGARLYKLP